MITNGVSPRGLSRKSQHYKAQGNNNHRRKTTMKNIDLTTATATAILSAMESEWEALVSGR